MFLGENRFLTNGINGGKYSGLYVGWKQTGVGYFKLVETTRQEYIRMHFQMGNANSIYEVFFSTTPYQYTVCRIAGDGDYHFWIGNDNGNTCIYTDMDNDVVLFDKFVAESPNENNYHLQGVDSLPSEAQLLTESSIPSFYKNYNSLAELKAALETI